MFEIHKDDEIVTVDNWVVGTVREVHHQTNPEQIDPDLKLFATYIEAVNLQLGDDFYIPTTYISGRSGQQLMLKLTKDEVLAEKLTREPQFVAHGRSKVIDLNPKD